jgi:hypothetical protein
MCESALKLRIVFDAITGEKDLGLREYELSIQDWKIVEDLHDVLKVCCSCLFGNTLHVACPNLIMRTSSLDLQGGNKALFCGAALNNCRRHPSH